MPDVGRRTPLLLLAVASMAMLLACGGRTPNLSPDLGDSGGDGAECLVMPCPSYLGWDPVTCACDVSVVSVVDAGPPVLPSGPPTCSAVRCPSGYVPEMLGQTCACVPSSPIVDAGPGHPAPDAAQYTYPDASYYYYPDATAYPDDAPYYYDAYPVYDTGYYPYDSGYYCYPYACGPGYAMDQYCNCVACAQTCPSGQTPGYGCSSCVACPYVCPAGLEAGPGCSCVPPGTDAGVVPPGDGGDGGGVSCLLEGYNQCAAGSWCELGVCPDNRTQYGCYCSVDGHATCDLSCPKPPPCTIPGEGICPYGSQCVYGSCASSGSVLVCSCNAGGQANCWSTSCTNDGGGPWLPDAGTPPADGGVTCLIEGYYSCNAGSFCSIGTCPDGTTQYGCFCNADGTATCNLTCPPPPPCNIPGEGQCPYQTQCTYGSCSGGSGTLLSCYCGYGGNANCYTYSCGGGGEAGAD